MTPQLPWELVGAGEGRSQVAQEHMGYGRQATAQRVLLGGWVTGTQGKAEAHVRERNKRFRKIC